MGVKNNLGRRTEEERADVDTLTYTYLRVFVCGCGIHKSEQSEI